MTSLGRRRLTQIPAQVVVSVGVFLAVGSSLLLFAYNPFQDHIDGVPVPARWVNGAVTWYLNPRTPKNNVDTTSGASIPDALNSAFNIWQQTQFKSQTLNNLTIVQGTPDSTLTTPNTSDCLNVVGFSDTSAADFPTGTIAFTEVATAALQPGQSSSPCGVTNTTSGPVSFMIDADMEFNPNQKFSTSTPPLANSFDLQSVASHEFGHLLGLDHSGIAHTMMFPFGDTGANQQRNLAIDDVIGVASLYPSWQSLNNLTGDISGTVTLSGTEAFAAHMVAIDAATGNVVLDGLTNSDGTYKLFGVPTGTYHVLVLPLAPDVNSGVYTLDDFSGWACGYGENSAPCCDPQTDPTTCTGKLQNPTNYTGKFF